MWPAINLIQNAILCKIGAGLHIGHRVRVAGAVRNQRSVAVCHWVAFAFPGQPGALLAIELGHGLRRGVAQIDDSHHFHIVDAMARTGAQVELVRRFTAPNGDKPSRVFLRFRRVGAVVVFFGYLDHARRIQRDGGKIVGFGIQQRVLCQRQVGRSGQFAPTVVAAHCAGIAVHLVLIRKVQKSVDAAVHRQPAIGGNLAVVVCRQPRQ